MESIKYVKKVIPCNFFINEKYLKKNNISYLVHGKDNKNQIKKSKLKIFKRTKNISSSILRNPGSFKNKKKMNKKGIVFWIVRVFRIGKTLVTKKYSKRFI